MPTGDNSTGHRKRLKERYNRNELKGFHDYEVIELLLTYAIPRRDVKPLAKELLRKFGGFGGVLGASVEELSEIKGVGENAALLLTMVRSVAGAYLKDRAHQRDIIRSPHDVIRLLELDNAASKTEKLMVVYLNTKNEVLGVENIHEGVFSVTEVSPRKVIENAFKHNARSIIFVHKVPFKVSASMVEKDLVRSLEGAATAIDILVHDYILVGKGSYCSARDSGLIRGG